MQHHISKCNFLFFNSFSRPSYRKISHKKIWRVQRCRIALKTQTFYVYTYTHIHMHNNTFTQTRIHTHSYTLIHTHTHTGGMKHHSVCENQERYICMCIYTHTHTHTHSSSLFSSFLFFLFSAAANRNFFPVFQILSEWRMPQLAQFFLSSCGSRYPSKTPSCNKSVDTSQLGVLVEFRLPQLQKKKKKEFGRDPVARSQCILTHAHGQTHTQTHTLWHIHMLLAVIQNGIQSVCNGQSTYICMFLYMHIYAYLYVSIYAHICIRTRKHPHPPKHIHGHTHLVVIENGIQSVGNRKNGTPVTFLAERFLNQLVRHHINSRWETVIMYAYM